MTQNTAQVVEKDFRMKHFFYKHTMYSIVCMYSMQYRTAPAYFHPYSIFQLPVSSKQMAKKCKVT